MMRRRKIITWKWERDAAGPHAMVRIGDSLFMLWRDSWNGHGRWCCQTVGYKDLKAAVREGLAPHVAAYVAKRYAEVE